MRRITSKTTSSCRTIVKFRLATRRKVVADRPTTAGCGSPQHAYDPIALDGGDVAHSGRGGSD
jgi:hypothetical protein